MRFSVQKEVITPQQPVFLSGFGARTRKHEGIIDDLYARAALLQHEGKPLLIVALDLTGGDRSFVGGIKLALKEAYGLQEDEVLINFSHTHYSVYVTGEDPRQRRGKYSIAQDSWPLSDDGVDYTEDVRYFHVLREKILKLTGRCFAELQEGTVRLARGTSDYGVSRRLMTEEGLKFRPNFAAPIDKDLFVLQLTDLSGRVKGILFSYACHPTSMGENRVSAEFPGAACGLLETRYPEAVAMFLQGCAADVKTAVGAGERFALTTAEGMRAAGELLGADVVGTIERGEWSAVSGPFETRLLDMRLFTEIWSMEDHERIARDQGSTEYRRLRAQMVADAIRAGTDKRYLPHYIQIWRLDEQTRLIAMEGEIPSAYALSIKRLLNDYRVIVLGYSNGVSSYIPTRQMLREGGYESEAFVLHGLRGPLAGENEDLIIGAVARSECLE